MCPEEEHYTSEQITLSKKTQKCYLDRIGFTFIELPKFEKQRHKDLRKLSQEEKFYYFLMHAPKSGPEQLAVLTQRDTVMRKAYQELDKFYWARRRYCSMRGNKNASAITSQS